MDTKIINLDISIRIINKNVSFLFLKNKVYVAVKRTSY